jgi:hypothetical protein
MSGHGKSVGERSIAMTLSNFVRRGCRIAALLPLFVPAMAQAAELDEAARKERCANNQARLDELTRQSKDLKLWTPIEGKRVADDIVNLTALAAEAAESGSIAVKDVQTVIDLASRYKFGMAGCVALNTEWSAIKDKEAAQLRNEAMEKCGIDLLDHIGRSSKANDEKMKQYKAILVEVHNHEVNLIALHCVDPTLDVAGDWNSDWGTMHLSGLSTIEGTYDYQGGRIYGQLDSYSFAGKWSQTTSGKKCKSPELGSYYWGRVALTFAKDGKSFSGSWSYCDGDPGGGGWSGSR